MTRRDAIPDGLLAPLLDAFQCLCFRPDIPELLIQIGRYPLQAPQGTTTQVFGSATEDDAWRPYWHENMMWYGPASFGRFVGVEEFQKFQVPFEAAFEGWGGGMSPRTPTRHFTRFADGDYICIGGWPFLQGTHIKPYLGFDPTGITTQFRVCDWCRLEGDRIVEAATLE